VSVFVVSIQSVSQASSVIVGYYSTPVVMDVIVACLQWW
jgi:hypothetical protein